MQTEKGLVVLKVLSIENQMVKLDANHPLAGHDLYFDVSVKEVRAETYYESGGIKEKWRFKQGLPNDECLFYYSDGSLYAKRNFDEGKEDGVSKYFYRGNKMGF